MSSITRKILIIEDDKDLQAAYSMVVSSQGYEVKTADDGMQGLNVLKNFKPDLIMLDYFMPRMDGRGFLQNFDQSLYPSTKIILASNISDQSIVEDLLSLGAHHYALKADLSPMDLIKLIDKITETSH